MNVSARLIVMVVAISSLATSVSAEAGEIIPNQSVTFQAAFESRTEAQEYVAAYFRASGRRVIATSEGLHLLYVGLDNGQHAVVHGSVVAGTPVCILVDFHSEEPESSVKHRSSESKARSASEAAALVEWLRGASAQSIVTLDARPWNERIECLRVRSNTSLERTRDE